MQVDRATVFLTSSDLSPPTWVGTPLWANVYFRVLVRVRFPCPDILNKCRNTSNTFRATSNTFRAQYLFATCYTRWTEINHTGKTCHNCCTVCTFAVSQHITTSGLFKTIAQYRVVWCTCRVNKLSATHWIRSSWDWRWLYIYIDVCKQIA